MGNQPFLFSESLSKGIGIRPLLFQLLSAYPQLKGSDPRKGNSIGILSIALVCLDFDSFPAWAVSSRKKKSLITGKRRGK